MAKRIKRLASLKKRVTKKGLGGLGRQVKLDRAIGNFKNVAQPMGTRSEGKLRCSSLVIVPGNATSSGWMIDHPLARTGCRKLPCLQAVDGILAGIATIERYQPHELDFQ